MIAEPANRQRLIINRSKVSLSPDEPFTWASGLKSPIYCDNRVTMSYPEVRRAIAQGLAAKIKEEFPNVEVIAGTGDGWDSSCCLGSRNSRFTNGLVSAVKPKTMDAAIKSKAELLKARRWS